MRYIELLPDVELYDVVTGELWAGPDGRQPTPLKMTHKQFLGGRLSDLAWGASFQLGKQQDKVADAIDEAHVYVAVEDADWEVLAKTVRTPSQQTPYNPTIFRSILPFGDAVLEAPQKLPDDWAAAELEARAAAADAEPKSDEEPPAPTED